MPEQTWTETRAGITAVIVADDDGIATVTCTACGVALVDDDRSPFYDAATDDGTPHNCPRTNWQDDICR
jgi:sugar (pentulose or hexulose) kinase